MTLDNLRARLAAPSTSRTFVGRDAAVTVLRAVLDVLDQDPPAQLEGTSDEMHSLLYDGWANHRHAVYTTVADTLASVSTANRGTTNRDQRGNTSDRAARRRWLIDTYGDGTTVLCVRCRDTLTVDTVTSDRIVPAVDGGTYARHNIRPMCVGCNSLTGGQLRTARARCHHDRATWETTLTPVLARLLAAVRCHPSGQRTYGLKQADLLDQLDALVLVRVQRVGNDLVARPVLTQGGTR